MASLKAGQGSLKVIVLDQGISKTSNIFYFYISSLI